MLKELSKQIFETIPPAMRIVRNEMRAAAKSSLTVPQFRVLANLNRGLKHITEISENLGVSQPAMSRLVEGLAKRNLIERTPSLVDRRSITLELTFEGRKLFNKVKRSASKQFESKLSNLTKEELAELLSSLSCIENIFNRFKDSEKS